MLSKVLPQKNTFVHFDDEELPTLYPIRSTTCPGSMMHDIKESDSQQSETESDLSEGERTPSPTLPVQGTKRWADLSEDEQTPAHEKIQGTTAPTLSTAGAKRWADLSEDEQTPAHQKSHQQQRCMDLPEDEQTPVHQKPHGTQRWADLSEDEQTPAHEKDDCSMGKLPDSKDEQDEKPEVMALPKPSRPQFAKPTREVRTRQFQAKLDEFFSLDFDEVDPSQQDGLTHRMLVGLKSLGELVNFWQPDGAQVSEEGFRLLGLEESDMYALGRVIRKADKLLEERRFREAYEKLCAARPWFSPDTLEDERAKAAMHAEKKESKDKKRACKSDDDEWTQVKKKDKKKACGADVDEWTAVNKKDKKKVRDEAPKKEQSYSKTSAQTSKVKPQSSNLNPQTSGFKTQSGQERKGPQKLLCRYNVCIEQDRAFNVVRKLLGDRGSHMKSIAENTGAKLRIRGRGSGFLEGPDQKEASDEPLMLCISAATREGFASAVQDVESLLEYVHEQYREFCEGRRLPAPRLSIVQREQPTH